MEAMSQATWVAMERLLLIVTCYVQLPIVYTATYHKVAII